MRNKPQTATLSSQIRVHEPKVDSPFVSGVSSHPFGPFQNGFTLIELIVVIVMLSVLLLGLIFTFNPLGQINKGKDLQRQHDLEQVKAALDSYYNDTGCYPTSLSFGSSWAVNQATYSTKLPQDIDYLANSSKYFPYIYQTDGSACPQWNVLYAGLRGPIGTALTCPLAKRASCVPQNFNVYYNFCLSSGSVNCTYVSSSNLPGGSGGGGGGGGGSTPTPTPTPYNVNCPSGNYYGCTSDNRCNSINPPDGKCFGHGGVTQCFCDQLCRVNGVPQCAN